jgi:hypothetical protein
MISLQSEVSGGDWLRSGTMIVPHSFFRVPEQVPELYGFVTGDFVLLRGCLISKVGGEHGRSFTVVLGTSSVWVQPSD